MSSEQPPPRPLSIACTDGYQLQGTLYEPSRAEDRQITVIVAPALFVRQRFYTRFASYLSRRGYRAITYANRGSGVSLAAETLPWAHRLRDWGELDLPAVIDHARMAAGSQERGLFFVGHSMGGQLVGLSPAIHHLDGVVTVAATSAYWGHWPTPAKQTIRAWYQLVRVLGRALPVFPAEKFNLGPDVASPLVQDWARWGRHPDYIAGPFGLDLQMSRYEGRLLIYSFTDDTSLGCRAAVEALHNHYTRAEATHHHVNPRRLGVPRLGHFGYYKEALGGKLWEETIRWMEGE